MERTENVPGPWLSMFVVGNEFFSPRIDYDWDAIEQRRKEETEDPDHNGAVLAIIPTVQLNCIGWYTLLALVAADAGTHCGLLEIHGTFAPTGLGNIVKGWQLTVLPQKWQWPGGTDCFGVPVAPPAEMWPEICAAIETVTIRE